MWGSRSLEAFVDVANDSGVEYYFTAGVALDALPKRETLTRDHADVNILISEVDKEAFMKRFEREGTYWNKNARFPKGMQKHLLPIELWPYTLANGAYIADGDKHHREYPFALLKRTQVGVIDGVAVPIVSDEQLLFDCVQKGNNARPEDDALFDILRNRMDKDLYKKIVNKPSFT